MFKRFFARRRNPILITHSVETLQDLYTAVADVVWSNDRPAPRNLDGFADMLRESGVRKVIASDWALDADDDKRVGRVLRDLGVELVR